MVESPFSLDIILFNGSFDSSSSFIILESSIGLWCTNNNCIFVYMFFFFLLQNFLLPHISVSAYCIKQILFFRDNFAIKMSENFQLQLNTLKMAPTVPIDQTVANSHNLIEKVFLCYYYCLLSN